MPLPYNVGHSVHSITGRICGMLVIARLALLSPTVRPWTDTVKIPVYR
jgi:hypothetical protein